MKTILTLLIVGTLCVTGRADTDAVLSGIRYVETQDQPYPPRGKLGERGPYQFRRSTWRMHTSSSFNLAENREVANTVAKRHYAWIEDQLRASGIEPSPYKVALAWNAGVNAVIRGRVPAVSYDYANRVINIASAIPDDIPKPSEPPKPAWRAPILVAEEASPSKSETASVSVMAAEPAAVPSPAVVVSTDSPAQDDVIEVRFHSDPITLAFSRTNTQEQADTAGPVQPDVSAGTLVVAGISDPSGRLPVSTLGQNLVLGVGIVPTRL